MEMFAVTSGRKQYSLNTVFDGEEDLVGYHKQVKMENVIMTHNT